MKDILGKDYDFEEVMRVPLIIHLPEYGLHTGESNTDFRQTVSIAGGQLDFLPTMAYLMGFPELDTIYLGQNLLTAKTGFVAQHTFMVKGSFFLDDIAYEMSRDGIFENGRAWNVETGEPVSLEGLEDYYHRSVGISETSQYLLDQDVLRQVYVEGKSLDEVLP
jgi:phosphoglycerol transferase MdoB-like AlkP superfamily enzyme